jgi:competence protein ComEC
LDVGQGLAAVIRTTGHTLVYGTGPRLGADYDAARAALIPFLHQQNIDHIDRLIIGHADNRHSGGVRSLLEQFSVGQVLTADRMAVPVEGAGLCRAGSEWHWDSVIFRILHPPHDRLLRDGDASCVLQIEAAGQRVLLAGDIEIAAQTLLVENASDGLASTILVAPGQGKNPPSPAFLAAVRPDYVLFSSGYKNRYGYPRAEAVAGYRRFGARILNTAETGAIDIAFGVGDKPVPQYYRQHIKRYWHAP